MVEKIADKRTAIMEAALKLFSEKGFKETSTANISQLAGVATGTLFLYFENKEELINRLYLESKEEFANYTRQSLEEEKTLKAELRHVWDRWMFWTIAHPEKAGFMLYFSASPFISKMTKEASMTNLSFINVLIKKALAGKQLAALSPELLTPVITGQMVTMGKILLKQPDKKIRDLWSAQGFEVMWKGIQK
jgi:AcrR family transcriptional regulator